MRIFSTSLSVHVGMRYLFGLTLVLFLSACSDPNVPKSPPQYWQGLEIVLETRPQVVTPGMNEFLVIITDKRGLPGSDLVVSLRTSETAAWSQAIQDGHSGVFRRAVRLASGQEGVFVQLKRAKDEVELLFPLRVAKPL